MEKAWGDGMRKESEALKEEERKVVMEMGKILNSGYRRGLECLREERLMEAKKEMEGKCDNKCIHSIVILKTYS